MALGNKTLEDLLAPISKQLGNAQVADHIDLPEWTHVPVRVTDGCTQAELVDIFADEASKIRVGVHRCSSADLASCVIGIIDADEAGSVICSDTALFHTSGLIGDLNTCTNVTSAHVWDAGKGAEMVEAARTARYGITMASGGIAETGTIVQPTSAECGRAVSLLPLVHIAVVKASTIKPTMLEVMKEFDDPEKLPSQVCFISGPSATADIELVRVEGVHGPMYVHYVIIDD